jgi:vacuolar-type H+-ATPase subunit D/Vma8
MLFLQIQLQDAEREDQAAPMDTSERGLEVLSQKIDALMSIMVQREAAAQDRETAAQTKLEGVCSMMETATVKLNELISSMMQREAELDVRNYNRSLGEYACYKLFYIKDVVGLFLEIL